MAANYLAQRFKRNIEADLVTEFKAVGYRFGGIIDAYLYASNNMLHDSFCKGCSGKTKDSDLPLHNVRPSGSGIQSDPDLMRNLRADFMEAQGRQQAYDAAWNRLRNLRQPQMRIFRTARDHVDSAGEFYESAFVAEISQIPLRNAERRQVASVQKSLLLHQATKAAEFGIRVSHVRKYMHIEIIINRYLLLCLIAFSNF